MLLNPDLRIIAGYVHNDGYTVFSPTPDDYSVIREGSGSYRIRWTPPFKAKPVVITQVHNAQQFVAVTTLEAGYCQVVTSASSGGAAADLPFMFIAMGYGPER